MLLTQALTSAAGRRKRQSANPTYSSIALSFLPSSSDGLLFNSTGLNGFTYLYVSTIRFSATNVAFSYFEFIYSFFSIVSLYLICWINLR